MKIKICLTSTKKWAWILIHSPVEKAWSWKWFYKDSSITFVHVVLNNLNSCKYTAACTKWMCNSIYLAGIMTAYVNELVGFQTNKYVIFMITEAEYIILHIGICVKWHDW